MQWWVKDPLKVEAKWSDHPNLKEQWLEVWSRYRGVRAGCWGELFVQITAKLFSLNFLNVNVGFIHIYIKVSLQPDYRMIISLDRILIWLSLWMGLSMDQKYIVWKAVRGGDFLVRVQLASDQEPVGDQLVLSWPRDDRGCSPGGRVGAFPPGWEAWGKRWEKWGRRGFSLLCPRPLLLLAPTSTSGN